MPSMQKVYLLLRNNTKTGPYSLEEVLQLNLKPFDLVWVEGRSAAWQYPFEVAALKPYVAETPQAVNPFQPIATEALDEKIVQQKPVLPKTEATKKIFVSIPKTYQTAAEQTLAKSDEIKPLASYSHHAYAPPNFYTEEKPIEEKATSIKHSRSLHDLEEDYTKWTYHKNTKKKSPVSLKDMVLVALMVTVIGGGYYVMSKPSVTNSVLPSTKTSDRKVDQATQIIADKSSGEKKEQEVNSSEQSIPQNTSVVVSSNYEKPSTIKKTKNPVNTFLKKPASVPQSKNSIPLEKTTSNITTDITKEVEVKQQTKTESQPVEKKKKFADVIKNIFGRKEKRQEAKTNEVVRENPRPAENRQATRRENNDPLKKNASEETTATNIMDQIELSSNAPDNWMMGVKNLKLTLHNRSNAIIQTASATVTYYDQNNQLLDKKIIYFSNIAPKGKASVAAPDSKWADHADFKLTTASAKEDHYAAY